LSEPRLKAPRGTFDVLGEQSAVRSALESRARAILEGAGYERIETPVFEATELFARGVVSPRTSCARRCSPSRIQAGAR